MVVAQHGADRRPVARLGKGGNGQPRQAGRPLRIAHHSGDLMPPVERLFHDTAPDRPGRTKYSNPFHAVPPCFTDNVTAGVRAAR